MPLTGSIERLLVAPNRARPNVTAAALACEAVVFRLSHSREPRPHAHRVTVRAPGGDYGAACYRIPRRVGPLDRAVGHFRNPCPMNRTRDRSRAARVLGATSLSFASSEAWTSH